MASTSVRCDEAEILRRAETLGIPWERILLEELRAEEKLRSHLAEVDTDCPIWSVMAVLSFSFLQSWRARDQIQNLSCQAREGVSLRAGRDLRRVFQQLTGKARSEQASLDVHLWLAYQRVLLLQRVSRAAEKSRGTAAERLAAVCRRTRCSYDDAAWAVEQADAASPRGHRLDAAIRKAREEGFLIPRSETEARSFAQLRRILRGAKHLAPRRRTMERRTAAAAAPRLPHAVHAN